MSAPSKSILVILSLIGFLMSGEAVPEPWTQTTWQGGPGQQFWGDTTMYYTDTGMDWESTPGDLMLRYPGWENTGELAGATAVWSIIQASDGSLYAGTQPNGDVFKSVDAGTTWVNTGEISGAELVQSLLEGSDGAIYAGVPDAPNLNGRVYKTTNGGATWFETGDVPDAGAIYELIQSPDWAIYASGDILPGWRGAVFKTSNGGATWTLTGDMPEALHTYTIFQAANGTIYAGANGCYCALWTTDGGATWNPSGYLDTFIRTFAQDSEGALYAAGEGGPPAHVFKTVDGGTTWVDMVALSESYHVESLLWASDGSIYAGTAGHWPTPGQVFRSTDAGTTWVRTGDLEGAAGVSDLLRARDGTMYAATGHVVYGGKVFRSSPPQGDLVSSVYDAGPNPQYGVMSWDETLNGQTLLMKVRTDTLSDMSTAPDWGSCPPAVNGDDISTLSSVRDGDPYIQYRVEMVSSRLDSTAVLHEVRIEYTLTGISEELNDQLSMTNDQLLQNHPNPFTAVTRIQFSVPSGFADQRVSLRVYDISGRLVRTLFDKVLTTDHSPLTTAVSWDSKDSAGREVAGGVYFYRLNASGFTSSRKLTLLR